MSRPVRIILSALALLAAAWLTHRMASTMYFQKRDELQREIETAREQLDQWQTRLDRRYLLDRDLQTFIDRTLGGDVETVDHRIRTRLNRLVEGIDLVDAVVGTGRASGVESPRRSEMGRRGVWAELRDAYDFVELEATVRGEGTLQQVVALVDAIEAEPWMKQVRSVRFDPTDNGARFTVSVRLSTIFLPGREPEPLTPPAYDGARLARYASLVQANPFRVPPPAQPAPSPAPPTQPEPSPSFDYGQWLLTGVVEAPDGYEVWLRHVGNGQTRALRVGQSIHELVLESVSGDRAVFAEHETRFLVAVGGHLTDRTPIKD